MVINTQGSRASYTGNGATTSFSFPNYIKLKSEIKVYVDNVLQTLNTHYTIAGTEPLVSGANIVFGTAPANGLTVLIQRQTGLVQSLNLTNSGSFNQDGIETVLDDVVLKTQDVYGYIESVGVITDSVAAAATSAATATTQAGIATTQAGNAATSASNAAISANNAAASANVATSAAASASAIAAGSLYAYTSSSGTVTGVNGAGYEFTATGAINLPVPTAGHTIRAILFSLVSGDSITFNRNGGTGTINDIADDVRIVHNGAFFLRANGTNWLLTGIATGV